MYNLFHLIKLVAVKNCLSFLAFVLLSTLSFAQNPCGFLRAKCKLIVDGSGQTFILRCMGMCGWMFHESYMFRLNSIRQQYKIIEKIADLVGAVQTVQLYDI